MNNIVEWYILHVHIGTENKVIEILQRKLPANLYRPFFPQKEIIFRRAGFTKIEQKGCFPSYVFIESKTSAEEFLNAAEILIRNIKEVHTILSYDGKKDIALIEDERLLLEKLLGSDDCIKVSRGFKIDGVTHITSGTLFGMENMIKKIDRNKRFAEIEIMLMGNIQRISVGVEITLKQLKRICWIYKSVYTKKLYIFDER